MRNSENDPSNETGTFAFAFAILLMSAVPIFFVSPMVIRVFVQHSGFDRWCLIISMIMMIHMVSDTIKDTLTDRTSLSEEQSN